MSLFSTKDLQVPETQPKPSSGAKKNKLSATGLELNSMSRIKETIGNLEDGDCCFYFTKGAWSNHDLIEYLIKEMAGPSMVWLSTWGVGEEALRRIHNMQSEGWITTLNCLFDHRISQQKAKELQLAKGMANRIQYMKNHSKVVSICGVNASFVIYTSANMTHNPRMEAGVVCRSRDIEEFTSTFIDSEIDG
jgi:hypothetical protein